MKDLVRLVRERDEKGIIALRENIKKMQEAELYPESFNFPITMQFELTKNCNLMCKHCYNASGIQHFNDRMTPEKWKEFARKISNYGGIFQCIISGGEPLLLGEDLFEIMDILHNDGTAFVVITNGYLLTPEKAKRLSKYRYMWFQISIDGATAEKHDKFRKVKGSWERAIKGALEISKQGIPLTIAHTVTPETLDDIDDMCELAYELGASSIIIGDVIPSGRSNENEDIFLTPEQKKIMLLKIQENLEKYKGQLTITRTINTKLQLKQYQATPNNGVIIRPNGDVRLDCMTPFILGNILEEDIKKIWLGKGVNCWHHEKVNEYIENLDIETNINPEQKNYVDDDIKL